MNDAMRTFLAVGQDGTTIHVSAYTESEARQKAEEESEFFILITIYMKLFAMLGGKGTVIGPIIGVIVLYSVQEYTWIAFPTAHLITFGIFIILVARFMPKGLVGMAVDKGWARKGMLH